MKKEYVIALIASLVVAIVVAAAFWFLLYQPQKKTYESQQQLHEKELRNMKELAELEKQEMENDYVQLADQYGEMMTHITNDSLIAQLTREQMRVRQLQEELKNVQSDNLQEITRLKRELNSVRAVLRDYIRQVDSLNRVNQTLRTRNSELSNQLEERTRQNENLQVERKQLTEKVTIAAQLNATGISMTRLNKKGKTERRMKMKDTKQLQVAFTIQRNVTAENGQRTLFVRIQTPTGAVLTQGGTFPYENRQLEYSMKKVIEYGGEETSVTTYWDVEEMLMEGEYIVSIFADGNMIGSRTFSFEK